jgi:hypothetical protein
MTGRSISIPVIRGKEVKMTEKEFLELQNYDSCDADRCARTIPGKHAEPWLNVIDSHEPSSLPGFELTLKDAAVRVRMRGRAIDVGAGTCWLSAKLSRVPEVDQVLAVDLSERFLATVGARVMKHFEADLRKLTFVASDFNDMPISALGGWRARVRAGGAGLGGELRGARSRNQERRKRAVLFDARTVAWHVRRAYDGAIAR